MDLLSTLFLLVAVAFACAIIVKKQQRAPTPSKNAPVALERTPLSVNYHFSRVCNYKCGFCFHTQTNDYHLPLQQAKLGLKLLKDAGMRKINFAGGEPFLYQKELGEMIKYCKTELGIESVSIVSNGSKLRSTCFIDEVNIKIGRGIGRQADNNHVRNVYTARDFCEKHKIKFKINTVVNRSNYMEDMNRHLEQLRPSRWKVFQVLILKTENDGEGESKRDGREFIITKDEFQSFLERHRAQTCLDNDTMTNSYLILDERMRFLNCQNGGKDPSESVLATALSQSGFDSGMFHKRGGEYDWTRNPGGSGCQSGQGYDW